MSRTRALLAAAVKHTDRHERGVADRLLDPLCGRRQWEMFPMSRVLRSSELPRFRSTRDGRRRVDLITDELFDTESIRTDRITYRPGDSTYAHSHRGCEHYFFVLEGSGTMHIDETAQQLEPGDVALVEAGEVHWFDNTGERDLVFIELWVPDPSDTVWANPADIETWAKEP